MENKANDLKKELDTALGDMGEEMHETLIERLDRVGRAIKSTDNKQALKELKAIQEQAVEAQEESNSTLEDIKKELELIITNSDKGFQKDIVRYLRKWALTKDDRKHLSRLKDIEKTLTKQDSSKQISKLINHIISNEEPKWVKGYLGGMAKHLEGISKQRNGSVTIKNRDAKDAIPVVITDKDRKKFVNAISSIVTGSYGKNVPFKTSSGEAKEALVNSDGSLVIDSKETTGFNGAPVTVGTTAVELTFTGTTQAIAIKSASTNTGLIWFGPSNIDNTGANAIGELTADSAVSVDFNDASAPLYVVSDTASQTIYKAALT